MNPDPVPFRLYPNPCRKEWERNYIGMYRVLIENLILGESKAMAYIQGRVVRGRGPIYSLRRIEFGTGQNFDQKYPIFAN